MPSFDTPGPIAVTVKLGDGDVFVLATERADTVVEVRPSQADREADRKIADQVKVDFAEGRLVVSGPQGYYSFTRGGSVDVHIEVPVRSSVRVVAQSASVHCTGALGDCEVKNRLGHLHVDSVGAMRVESGIGDVTVDRVGGAADVRIGSGAARIREIHGTATVRNANGDIWLGTVRDELRIKATNGGVSVDEADTNVDVKAGNGKIRVGGVVRGLVTLVSGFGDIDVAVREGTALQFDAHTKLGEVRNLLQSSDGPGDAAEIVQLKARTGVGDIVIQRA